MLKPVKKPINYRLIGPWTFQYAHNKIINDHQGEIMLHRHRKLLITISLLAVIAIVGVIFIKATLSPDKTPIAVTAVKEEVFPNQIFESYKYPHDLRIIHSNAKLYSAPAGTNRNDCSRI
ncbi:hypothetical protein DM476_05290 [Lactobacillus helveticus]|nr:hypothetical protein DM476_05290 [Lactobacillus helveticus]